MKHKNDIFKNPFDIMVPFTLFVTGLVLCGVIRVVNVVYGMSLLCIPDANYFVSKPCVGTLNYVELCVLTLSGFVIMGLVNLICSKGRLFSAALVVICICICTNTCLLKAGLRIAHFSVIERVEKRLLEDYQSLWVVQFYQHIYVDSVEKWNAVEDEKFEPIAHLIPDQNEDQ